MRQQIRTLFIGLVFVIYSTSMSYSGLSFEAIVPSTHFKARTEFINATYLALLPYIALENSTLQRTVNAPFFDVVNVTQQKFSEMAIFWFGQVSPTTSYTDVRVGYNNSNLYVHLNIYDRLLWYDLNPTPAKFDQL